MTESGEVDAMYVYFGGTQYILTYFIRIMQVQVYNSKLEITPPTAMTSIISRLVDLSI